MVLVKFAVLLLLLATSAPSLGQVTQHDRLVRPTAMPTSSATPTVTALPTAPTAAPTDSPAPSPSPSAIPSYAPTGTPAPTVSHSRAPTESPAPSPSPSAAPTDRPSVSPSEAPSHVPSVAPSVSPSVSPTDVPSVSPSVSVGPSVSPTVSSAPSSSPSETPSGVPSDRPSVSPSAAPSVSARPSVAPSPAPTDQPSLSPTHAPSPLPSSSVQPSWSPTLAPSSTPTIFHDKLQTVIAVTFRSMHSMMENSTLKEVFEETTFDFLQSNTAAPENHILEFTGVEVVEQTYNPLRRELAGRALSDSGYRIRMNVTARVVPGDPPLDYSFTDEVSAAISEKFIEYAEALEAADPFFTGIAVANSPSERTGSDDLDGDQVRAGKAAGIVVGAFAAVAIAAASAFYAVRHRDIVRARSVGSTSKGDRDLYLIDSHSTDATPHAITTTNPTSPNSLESGKSTVGMFPLLSRSFSITSASNASKTSIQSSLRYSESNGTGAPKSILDTVMSIDERETEEERDDGSPGSKYTSGVLSAHGGKKDPPTGIHDAKPQPPGKTLLGVIRTLPSSCFSSDDELSPKSVDLDTPASNTSTLSSFSRFLDGEVNLGARPMGETEQEQYRESHSTGSAPSMKKTGTFDVFAPPGPLGIVVDTGKEGPVVHSLKPSSVLLGLVTPGDLIVGLDDMDTRGMTAATLTRMMAKRSNQKERKITLLSPPTD